MIKSAIQVLIVSLLLIGSAYADGVAAKAPSRRAVVVDDAPVVQAYHYGRCSYHAPISVTVYPGSLMANVKRIARQYCWPKVVWSLNDDYMWTGTAKIQAPDLQHLFAKLLADYPIQAIFYDGNHVLLIRPRQLS